MRANKPDAVRFPRLYQEFGSAKEIAEVINRSPSYVKKALRDGFTDREKTLIGKARNRTDLFEERIA